MKDMIPKGTGNSRFLRSVSNFKAIYPTYDDFVNALVAGNLPVDFNGINEAGIQQVGTPLSKANLLTDETAAALGLEQENPTINDAFGVLGVVRKKHEKIASYETAGSYQWTAPDLADGKAYKIGVMIIGAGGSGCADKTGTGSSQYNHCSGGASGYSRAIAKEVSPGEVITLVVGKGGARVSDSTDRTVGKTGGTSSFDGVTALGGEGGDPVQDSGSTAVSVTLGACPGRSTHGGKRDGFFGMDRSDIDTYYDSYLGIPAQCFNPFEQKEILASGGGAYTAKTSSGSAGKGGKNPLTGKGGGDGAYNISGNATATAATEPGCGGGSASASGTATSGAGADGAVYIYFLGVADE